MKDRTQINKSETTVEELVAYLDGELDNEASGRVERRLADDALYRLQLQRLQRAWDMLDFLPPAEVNEDVVQTTIERVAVNAADEARHKRAKLSVGRQVSWGVAAAIILFAAFLGYRITSFVFSASNRELVRDLPVIQNVDLYHHVDSIDFLRELENSGLFADDAEEVGRET